MKRIVAIMAAVTCLFSMAVPAYAVEQNYCAFFEQEINMLHGQREDVLPGDTFSIGCITKYTNYREDFSAYDYTSGNVNFCIPADVYEAAAQKHFLVAPDQLRKRYNGYYEEENAYYLTLNAYDDIAPMWRYLIQGYEHAEGQYVAYFEKVSLDYREPGSEPGLAEGKDYVLTWITDKSGNSAQKAALLLDQKLKVTMEYDGKNVKFLAWETVSSIPELSDMTIPTAPISDKTTTAEQTATITDNDDATETTSTVATNDDDLLKATNTQGSMVPDITVLSTALNNNRITTTDATTTSKSDPVTTEREPPSTVTTTVETQPLETVFETENVTLQAAVTQPGDPFGTILLIVAIVAIVGAALCVLFCKKSKNVIPNEDTETE